jgi:hypothetical protein
MIDAPIYGAQRFAVSPDQVAEHDLLTKPRKATDRRSLENAQALEVEATPAGVIHRIHRSETEEPRPRPALKKARASESSERDHLRRITRVAGGRS